MNMEINDQIMAKIEMEKNYYCIYTQLMIALSITIKTLQFSSR